MLLGLKDPSFYLIISILLPIIGGFVILLLNNRPNIRDSFVVINALTTLLFTTLIFLEREHILSNIISISTPSSNSSFVLFSLDKFGLAFAMLASFLWVITSIYSIGYMRGHKEKNQTRFYFFFAISIAFTLAIAYSGSLLTMFLFYEMLTVATFPLVTHNANEEAKKSGRIYIGILMGSSVLFLLPAILGLYYLTGNFTYMPNLDNSAIISPPVLFGLLMLFAYGLAKAALMPLHRWLPAAMVAPTPVSSLLHAVAVVKSGVFIFIKVITLALGVQSFNSDAFQQSFIFSNGLLLIACFTIIAGSFIALKQDNIKKMLAYSTIAQLSYIIMAMAMFSQLSALVSMFHIVAHAFSKITLFFVAGAIAVTAHKKNISEIAGIAKRMPITITAFFIASLSLIGIPGTIGFVSKFSILQVAMYEGNYFVMFTLLISTILNVLYLLKFAFIAIFKEETKEHYYDHKEADIKMLLPICITTACVILLFFDFTFKIFVFKYVF